MKLHVGYSKIDPLGTAIITTSMPALRQHLMLLPEAHHETISCRSVSDIRIPRILRLDRQLPTRVYVVKEAGLIELADWRYGSANKCKTMDLWTLREFEFFELIHGLGEATSVSIDLSVTDPRMIAMIKKAARQCFFKAPDRMDCESDPAAGPGYRQLYVALLERLVIRPRP